MDVSGVEFGGLLEEAQAWVSVDNVLNKGDEVLGDQVIV